jgi:hypothetical protein
MLECLPADPGAMKYQVIIPSTQKSINTIIHQFTIKMKKNLFPLYLIGLFAFSLLTFTACEEEFDEPPVNRFSDIQANTTIADLKALHELGSSPDKIEEDLIIEGIVISDDRAGNFYKSLVIQDATGGLEVRIDAISLFLDYPRGSKVWVNCNGLYIDDFSNKHQLVIDDQSNEIPEPLMGKYVIPGPLDPTEPVIEARVVDLADIQGNTIDSTIFALTSTLIKFEGVEFSCVDAGATMADALNKETKNATLQDCDGNTVLVRNSGFSEFAFEQAPEGNGTLTCVFGVFNTDRQVFIRDMADLNMEGPRCVEDGCGTVPLSTIREEYILGATTVSGGFVQGIVISDRQNGNIVGQNLVLQDESGGIVIRFTGDHSFDLGDELYIGVAGLELSEFNGLLQISNVPEENASVVGQGEITPRVTTVSEILANFEDWESTLVKIEGATISGNATFAGSTYVDDGTGDLLMFTRNDATFAGESVPIGTVNVTAILSQFNDRQLNMRVRADVEGGVDPNVDFNETFDDVTLDETIDLPGWTVYNEAGTVSWEGREFSDDRYASINPFNSGEPSVICWLITPSIDLSDPKTLTFNCAQGFKVQDGLSVWISTDFDGSNVSAATWTQLSPTLPTTQANYEDVASGPVDLSGFSGTGYIAFRYEGDGNSNTTLYQLDDVKVSN